MPGLEFTITKDIRIISKIDHSAYDARIVLVEYTIGSVVEQNFVKVLKKIW